MIYETLFLEEKVYPFIHLKGQLLHPTLRNEIQVDGVL
jgi:hypothetical protein